MKFSVLFTSALYARAVLAASPIDWRSRSIYQVLTDRFARTDGSTTAPCRLEDRTYCGGTYRGIINRLDYIQGMGFNAIWISPITLQIEGQTSYGEAYHGYWQQKIYELNPHFGSGDDLRALATELHNRGMYLMLDIIVNHNAWNGESSTVDYSRFHPFNRQDFYHPYCPISNWSNQWQVENCWMGDDSVALADLDTQSAVVANEYNAWISALVSNYSVDGLRIDSAKHVQKEFWPGFKAASGVFTMGEVFTSDAGYTCPYQQYLDSVMNYPIYDSLIGAFNSTSGSISGLVNQINIVKSACADSTILGTFSENHDNPRFPCHTSDLSLAKNVIAFTILADGIPIIYSGQEQHYAGCADPANREALWPSGYDTSAPLYTHIAQLNRIRNRAIYMDPAYLSYKNEPIYSDSTTIAMRKGFNGNQVVTVLSNQGSSGPSYTFLLGNTGHTSGQQLVEVLTCSSVIVDGNGNIPVSMNQGMPRVFYPAHQLSGSGICGR